MTEITVSLEKEILQKLAVSIIVIDSKGFVDFSNEAARSLFNKDIVGQSWLDIIQQYFIIRPDDGYEISMINGRRVNISLSTLKSIPGQLISISDVTETRNYQQQQETEKRLASIGQMTAQLAHQFRTPIASAMLYCDNLASFLPDDEKLNRWLSHIEQSFQSMQQQIDDLLIFARGQNWIKREDAFSVWLKAFEKRIEHFNDYILLKLDVDSRLSRSNFPVHSESLSGAIENIIQNAIEADADEVRIEFLLHNEGILIKITDNGHGMPDEMKQQAFEPFYSSKAKGTGLGLANVNAVVKAHHGCVHVDSRLEQGCCFQLLLRNEGSC